MSTAVLNLKKGRCQCHSTIPSSTIVIQRKDLYYLYPQIGYGAESSVVQYDDSTALKIFWDMDSSLLTNKLRKIEAFRQFQDDDFCFPKGFVDYEDGQRAGCHIDLVVTDGILKTFEDISCLTDQKRVLDLYIKGAMAMERIHQKGFIIGDVKEDNIMIDYLSNPRFVDVDNYAYGEFDFDLFPGKRNWFKKVFGKDCSSIDSDKYLYAMMCLQYFASGTLLHYARSPFYFNTLIQLLNVDSQSKEILGAIFSDAEGKPSIAPVLRKIHPEQQLLQKKDIYALNRIC